MTGWKQPPEIKVNIWSLTSRELYFKYMYAKFMLNEIGVYSVSWLDVSFANKENK
jgi:hypothetical protein